MAQQQKQNQFTAAANTEIPFGPFEGKTIDVVAQDENGLSYLDNLRGKIRGVSAFTLSLATYLDSPVVVKALDDLIDARERRYTCGG